MRKTWLTEHQIISVLKSVKADKTVTDVCREVDIFGSQVLQLEKIWRDGSH